MTKLSQHKKAQSSDNGRPVLLEQNTMIDDTILPNAEELAKLKEIDPALVDWVMKRCEQEQNFRHDFSNKQIGLAKKEMNGNLSLHWACIITVFLLISGAFVASVYMLLMGINVAGSIFAVGTVTAVGIAFSKLLPGQNKQKNK